MLTKEQNEAISDAVYELPERAKNGGRYLFRAQIWQGKVTFQILTVIGETKTALKVEPCSLFPKGLMKRDYVVIDRWASTPEDAIRLAEAFVRGKILQLQKEMERELNNLQVVDSTIRDIAHIAKSRPDYAWMQTVPVED